VVETNCNTQVASACRDKYHDGDSEFCLCLQTLAQSKSCAEVGKLSACLNSCDGVLCGSIASSPPSFEELAAVRAAQVQTIAIAVGVVFGFCTVGIVVALGHKHWRARQRAAAAANPTLSLVDPPVSEYLTSNVGW
jgi:hypothetical protein